MGTKPVLIAVDTNVLLDQAVEDPDVLDAISTIRERLSDARFYVLPTCLEELGVQLAHGNREERAAAEKALLCMREWGYEPINLIAAGKGIAERISFKLRSFGLLPDEEENDGFIVAEAALLGCDLLLSSDHHLIEAGTHPQFHSILKESEVDGDHMVIGNPRTIANKFFRKK